MNYTINEVDRESSRFSGHGPRLTDNPHPGLKERIPTVNPEDTSRNSHNHVEQRKIEEAKIDIQIKFLKEPTKKESKDLKNQPQVKTVSEGLFAKTAGFLGYGKKRKRSKPKINEPSLKEIIFRQKMLRFIQNLRGHACFKNIKKPAMNVLSIINDLSFDELPQSKNKGNMQISTRILAKESSFNGLLIQYFKHQLCFLKDIVAKKCSQSWELFETRVPTIKPLGRMKLAWDFLMVLLIFWHLISLSILVSFRIAPWQAYSIIFVNFKNGMFFEMFQYISFALLLIDILLKFNTGCFENGTVIYEKGKIVRAYFRSSFLFDFLGIIPFIVFFTRASHEEDYLYYFSLFVFKIGPLYLFFDHLSESLFSFEGKKESMFLLMKLLGQVFLVCHLGACAWHLTAVHNSQQKNWIKYLDLEDAVWESRYLKAIYYVVVTMTTTGYGDITPQNRDESLLAIFCMFAGSIMVGYSINSIRDILKKAASSSKLTKKKVQILNSFMTRNSLSFELQVKIRKYLGYIWSRNLEQDKEAHEILKELPGTLREEILINTQRKFLKGQTIFNKYFSPDTVLRLAPVMQPIHLSPDEWIFLEGDLDDESLYIVSSGNVELFVECGKRGQNRTVLSIIKPQTIFGELSFFTGFPRECSSRAQDVCTLLKIDKVEFLNILKQDPSDYETFCLIRDQLILDLNRRELDIKCSICNSDEHSLPRCPWVSHQPNRDTIITRYLFSKPQTRSKFPRKRLRKSQNSLLEQANLQSAFEKLRDREALQVQEPERNFIDSYNTLVSMDSDSPKNASLPEQDLKDFQPLSVIKQNQQRRSLFSNRIPEDPNESKELSLPTGFSTQESAAGSLKVKSELLTEKRRESFAVKHLNNLPAINIQKLDEKLELKEPTVLSVNLEVSSPKNKGKAENSTEKRRESIFNKIPRRASVYANVNKLKQATVQSNLTESIKFLLANDEERLAPAQQKPPEPNKIEENSLILFKDFEKLHNWNIYMPHNNVSAVLLKKGQILSLNKRYNNKRLSKMASVKSPIRRMRKTVKQIR